MSKIFMNRESQRERKDRAIEKMGKRAKIMLILSVIFLCSLLSMCRKKYLWMIFIPNQSNKSLIFLVEMSQSSSRKL